MASIGHLQIGQSILAQELANKITIPDLKAQVEPNIETASIAYLKVQQEKTDATHLAARFFQLPKNAPEIPLLLKQLKECNFACYLPEESVRMIRAAFSAMPPTSTKVREET